MNPEYNNGITKNKFQQKRAKTDSWQGGDPAEKFESQKNGVDLPVGNDFKASKQRNIPREIGNYPIIRFIGKGGYGEVYLAKHPGLDKEVVLKVFSLPISNKRNITLDRFRQEAMITDRLHHPNIIRVHDSGEDNLHGYYIVMEYANHGSVHNLLKKNSRLDIKFAFHIIKSVASALVEAHGENIIHRDIKPENIMLSLGKHVKLADFGLAKFIYVENEGSVSQKAYGTPGYMAPEQVQNAKHVDPTADIFSLGVTFYELTLGLQPFAGSSSYEKMNKVVNGDFKRPEEIEPDFDPKLSQIICKMMELSPKSRYQTAEEVLEALDDYEWHLSSSKAKSQYHQPSPSEVKSLFLSPARIWSAGSLVVLALLVALFFIVNPIPTPDTGKDGATNQGDYAGPDVKPGSNHEGKNTLLSNQVRDVAEESNEINSQKSPSVEKMEQDQRSTSITGHDSLSHSSSNKADLKSIVETDRETDLPENSDMLEEKVMNKSGKNTGIPPLILENSAAKITETENGKGAPGSPEQADPFQDDPQEGYTSRGKGPDTPEENFLDITPPLKKVSNTITTETKTDPANSIAYALPNSKIPILISTRTGKKKFRDGDSLQLVIQPESLCYITVLWHFSNGHTMVVFSHESNPREGFPAGARIPVPNQKDHVVLEIGPPYGTDFLQVIACNNKEGLEKILEVIFSDADSRESGQGQVTRSTKRGGRIIMLQTSERLLPEMAQNDWGVSHIPIITTR